MALKSIRQNPKDCALVLGRKNQVLPCVRISPLPDVDTKRFNCFLRNQTLAAYKASHSSSGLRLLQRLRLHLSPQ